MNLTEIQTSLKEIFNAPLNDAEERKIVFWTDLDKDFKDYYTQVELEEIKLLHLHKNNQFYIKHLLEEEDTTSSYLIYTNLDLESDQNWLYDIVQYSQIFYADRVSLLMKEYNINTSLRHTVQKYIAFFGAQDRRNRLKRFDMKFDTQSSLELAMMNSICREHSLDFRTVLRTVLMDTLEDKDNRYLHDFKRFFDIETFWSYVKDEYAYSSKQRTLKSLFTHLAVTALSQSISENQLSELSHLISDQNKTSIYVFVDQWMHHKTDYKVFDEYIKIVEEKIDLPSIINDMPIETFKDADVFPYIDRAIIMYIANELVGQYEDFDMYLDLIKERRNKHFYQTYRHMYESLYYTVKIFKFHKKYESGIPQGDAIDIYKAYTEDYYVMDTYYRKFYVAYDAAGSSELLLKLKTHVENKYTNWYMGDLSAHWSQSVEREMADKWSLPGIYNQQQFYSNIISRHGEERVFVIISDALRYEIGVELGERLNNEIIGSCEMNTMLGVVPSVTKLGMASLLPHQKLSFDNKGRVLVDGASTAGIDNRQKILSNYVDESLAIHYKNILDMNKGERRETFKGKKLIYIYHDTIDATGDNSTTEINTFNAAEDAIDQISGISRIIRNELSGTHVYITADHGFIYQREKLEVTDLLAREDLKAIDTSRRHILSDEHKEVSGQQCINLSSIIHNAEPLYAYVPNATMRYRVQGAGANFVHGGASLQEVVVPMLYIRNKRAGQSGAKKIEEVNISLTSTARRITNSIFTLSFFQTEKIGDKTTSKTVVIYMEDEDGNVLSNEETIIGDLESNDPKQRIFKVQFVLQNKVYDRDKIYYLTIQNTKNELDIERIPFSINLGFVSDFDF